MVRFSPILLLAGGIALAVACTGSGLQTPVDGGVGDTAPLGLGTGTGGGGGGSGGGGGGGGAGTGGGTGTGGTSTGGTGTGSTTDCTYPDLQWPDTAPVGAMPTPPYMAVSMVGVPVRGDLKDFVDGEEVPAYMAFEFLDLSLTPVCVVIWDGGSLTEVPANSWPTDSGGRLYNAWELTPTGGFTDCGEVDAGTFGGETDIRRWIASLGTWGVGLGEMTPTVSADLSPQVGADWATLWEPYVFGTYVSRNGQALEMGYAFSYEQECGDVTPGPVDRPRPTGEIDGDMVNGASYWVFNVEAFL